MSESFSHHFTVGSGQSSLFVGYNSSIPSNYVLQNPTPFVQETLELQSNLQALQLQLNSSFTNINNQIIVGLNKVNKMIELLCHKITLPTDDTSSQISTSQSVTGSTDHEMQMDKIKPQLRRISERPTVSVTGRKADIETPVDSMRSSMACVMSSYIQSPQNVSSAVIASQSINAASAAPPMVNANGIAFPTNAVANFPAKTERHSYHGTELEEHFKKYVEGSTTLSMRRGGGGGGGINQLQQQIQPLIKFERSSGKISATNQSIKSQYSVKSTANTGIRWDAKDYIQVSETTPKKPVSSHQNSPILLVASEIEISPSSLKRAKSANYQQPKVNILKTAELQIQGLGKKLMVVTNADDGTSDSPKSSLLSQSATSIGKWVDKIFPGRETSHDSSLESGILIPGQVSQSNTLSINASILARSKTASRRQSFHGLSTIVDKGEESRPKTSPLTVEQNIDQEGCNRRNDTKEIETRVEAPKNIYSAKIKADMEARRRSDSFNGDIFDKDEVIFNEHVTAGFLGMSIPKSPHTAMQQIRSPSMYSMPPLPTTNSPKSIIASVKEVEPNFIDQSTTNPVSIETLEDDGSNFQGIYALSPFAGVYLFSLVYLPYHAAFTEDVTDFTDPMPWLLSFRKNFFVINFFTPELNYRYERNKNEKIQIPWTQIFSKIAISFTFTLIAVISRNCRLPKKLIQNNQFLWKKKKNWILRSRSILDLVGPCIMYFVGRSEGFKEWNVQFEYWAAYPGGILSASMHDRYIWMLFQSAGNTFPFFCWIALDQTRNQYRAISSYVEESDLLADFNDSLRRVPFLKRNMGDGRDEIFIKKIAMVMKQVFYVPGDLIFSQGERATVTGTVSIIMNKQLVAKFGDSNFFGEVALIANIPRTASVQALTTCNLYCLSAKDFQLIAAEFDDIRQKLEQIYEDRMMRTRLEHEGPEDISIYPQSTIQTRGSRRLSNFIL
ncbi:hypothetical protein HK100_000743 [Physocladia obscura]|uniref:Cyclic nucleotide-binding domain-containing protein n=1 Tax=Physocladia obscura TaxID=109957 RepID=A0AAD5SZH2_9FUNG|nr:hypothetical protein HK100_000743 [Physocladia obscura]